MNLKRSGEKFPPFISWPGILGQILAVLTKNMNEINKITLKTFWKIDSWKRLEKAQKSRDAPSVDPNAHYEPKCAIAKVCCSHSCNESSAVELK